MNLGLHTAYCLLPTTYCLLPTAYCPLPTAYCPLPTAYCQLTTDNGRLTTDGRQPICVIIRSPVGNRRRQTAVKLRIRNDELYRDTV
jgi:hypothetical protein